MRLQAGTVNVLSEAEVQAIHAAALRILGETGMWIENEEILRHLEGFGGRVDHVRQRVRYPAAVVERFLSDSDEVDWAAIEPEASASAGVYYGLYHDPESGDLLPWTEERLAGYFALARALEHVGGYSMLGCPFAPVPQLEPLYEKLYCWKYGGRDSGTIQMDELCPYLYDLFQLRAQQLGRPLADVFHGTAYLVPPLKLGRHEAYQFLYFWKRGLRVHIGDMYAMGATSPVTLAGSIALNLAEQVALGILSRAFHGGSRFRLGCSVSVIDMRTMIYPYGRPEMALTTLATAQMARHYRVPFGGHAGLSDAKLPSVEAGAQKALTAIPTLLAGGHVNLDAGLLSIDEVCSPLQMILDNEFCGALKQLCRGFGVTEEDLAVDLVAEVGPGGNFMATEHTARRFRSEHWEPGIWSRQMLGPWLAGERKLDVDYARDRYRELEHDLDTEPRLTDEEERDIRRIVESAYGAATGSGGS